MSPEMIRQAIEVDKTELALSKEFGGTVQEMRKILSFQLLLADPAKYRSLVGVPVSKEIPPKKK